MRNPRQGARHAFYVESLLAQTGDTQAGIRVTLGRVAQPPHRLPVFDWQANLFEEATPLATASNTSGPRSTCQALYTNNQSHADEQRQDGPYGVEEGIDRHQNFLPTVIVP